MLQISVGATIFWPHAATFRPNTRITSKNKKKFFFYFFVRFATKDFGTLQFRDAHGESDIRLSVPNMGSRPTAPVNVHNSFEYQDI